MKVSKASFYKWHRILGLIALVPVIFWTLSGLFHPFMSNWFRPQIALEVYQRPSQNSMHPVLSIQEVMDKNRITELRNFSLVKFNHTTYYQVMRKDSVYYYYSANNGKQFPNADRSYAVYLARYFTRDSISKVKSITLQRSFDGQYQPINHLLPVWKISFDRPDGMDVYVETGQSRMGTFNNNTRKVFLWAFEQFHTWNFLAAIGGERFRIVVLIIFIGILFLSLLSGLTVYAFFWKKFKGIRAKRDLTGKKDQRLIHRYHRQIGLYISFILLLFLISAAFHLFIQIDHSAPERVQYAQLINRRDLRLSNLKLPIADSCIKRISLVNFHGHTWYQITDQHKQVLYDDATTGKELAGGDQQYALFLSNYYTNGIAKGNSTVTRIGQFDNDYGFINKRLPVQRVSYVNGENWYFETATSKLATKVAGMDRAEGLSFIFMHKFFWMTWAGKNIRDIVSMAAALTVLVVSLLGFAAFIKNS